VDAAAKAPPAAATTLAAPTHADLSSMREARDLVARAQVAQKQLAELSQAQIDAIVDAMAAAVTPQCEALAQLAFEETGFGVAADKVRKNRFAAETVYQFIKPMKTVGVLRRIEATRVVEIAEPFGVVAAIIPTTNPTSTAIYKILISIKARCAIVMSPHPSAKRCITRVAEIMEPAARAAGLPDGAITCLQTVTLEGTQELMRQRGVRVILATGGMGLVRAAYSAGKPAYGVGPGNAPAFIERTADVKKAVADILTGKTFDNGLLCSSENSVVVDEPIAAEAKAQFLAQGAYFLNAAEADALAKVLVTPQRLPNPALVGRPATVVAQKAGIAVPPGTRALIAELQGVGRDHPLSIEKLCPVLSFYVVKDWQEGCVRCQQILQYGGMGHTMSIHSRNDDVILQFGLKKPAFRIVVNTPTTLGSIGLTTSLDPAMTLGCGGWGGNITSDNISPLHLINVKRLAYETKPARPGEAPSPMPRAGGGASTASSGSLSTRVGAFLESKGFAPAPPTAAAVPTSQPASAPTAPQTVAPPRPAQPLPVAFVCEDDVRAAARAGRRIVVGPKTIITPAARDAAEALRVFEIQG
jgi:acetaldehyde dehydrogenase (acetylating)